MGRKRKEDTYTEAVIKQPSEPLGLTPENIVDYIAKNGKLPDDFNPYGSYMPERSKFLGDEPPKDTPYYIGINTNDDDLIPIYISSPKPPRITMIDNYYLPKDEQYWRRPEVPPELIKLERRAYDLLYLRERANRQETVQGYRVYQKYWELLSSERKKYKKEIAWIKKMWWHRVNGYWMYNDGEPVYLSGDYFDYLTFWYIKEAEIYPNFREEDRVISIFSQYLETTTETFTNMSPDNGRAQKDDDGKYEMTDVGSRVFFGEMTPKFRRAGETQRGCHKVWKGTSTTQAAYGTIISMEGLNAEKHYYKKLVPAWNKYPMFLKPIWMGSKRPTSIKMIEPPNVFHIEGLGSVIDYTDSAGVTKNDGDTLYFSLCDEEGKSSRADIFERWSVNKVAMSRGGGTNIIGYSMHPSTVEEMDEAGMEFYRLGQLSCFYERMPVTGQTYSGLARIFIPAFKKLDGFIDRWGKSVIDKPSERQKEYSPRAKFALMDKGAKDALQSQLDSLLSKGTPEALEAYRSRRRKFPMRWADCWLGASGNVGFNMEIIDRRIEELNRMRSFEKPPYKIGYFYRENDNPDGRVVWKNDSESPKFKISMDLPEELANQREKIEVWDGLKNKMVYGWRPLHGHKFTLGADPFRNLKAQEAKQGSRFSTTLSNSRQSDGGIVVLWEHDKDIDTTLTREEWESFRTVLTYKYRPATQDEYFEDILMAAQYFGAMIYPEQNVERLISYVYDRGYGGYFLFDIGFDGKRKAMPGRYNAVNTNQDMICLLYTSPSPRD